MKSRSDHEFHEACHSVTSHCTGQFTPKMKANAVLLLLSSLVRIDQYNECNGMTSFMEFMIKSTFHTVPLADQCSHRLVG